MKINVLGQEYIIKIKKLKDDEGLEEVFGYCDGFSKQIIIRDIEDIKPHCINKNRNFKLIQNKILRHEIIHAFFNESGLMWESSDIKAWSTNEEMIDWFALQIPKISKIFKKLNIEE